MAIESDKDAEKMLENKGAIEKPPRKQLATEKTALDIEQVEYDAENWTD